LEVHPRRTELRPGTLRDFLAANPNSVVFCPLAAAPYSGKDVNAAASTSSITWLPIAITWLVVTRLVRNLRAPVVEITAAPHDIEGISFLTAVFVLNSDYRGATVTGIANQLHIAPAIDSLKPEIRHISRHSASAFKPAPLRGLARKIAERCVVPVDFDFRSSVNHHFNCAFT
jgi:hypothetical protein